MKDLDRLLSGLGSLITSAEGESQRKLLRDDMAKLSSTQDTELSSEHRALKCELIAKTDAVKACVPSWQFCICASQQVTDTKPAVQRLFGDCLQETCCRPR